MRDDKRHSIKKERKQKEKKTGIRGKKENKKHLATRKNMNLICHMIRYKEYKDMASEAYKADRI